MIRHFTSTSWPGRVLVDMSTLKAVCYPKWPQHREMYDFGFQVDTLALDNLVASYMWQEVHPDPDLSLDEGL